MSSFFIAKLFVLNESLNRKHLWWQHIPWNTPNESSAKVKSESLLAIQKWSVLSNKFEISVLLKWLILNKNYPQGDKAAPAITTWKYLDVTKKNWKEYLMTSFSPISGHLKYTPLTASRGDMSSASAGGGGAQSDGGVADFSLPSLAAASLFSASSSRLTWACIAARDLRNILFVRKAHNWKLLFLHLELLRIGLWTSRVFKQMIPLKPLFYLSLSGVEYVGWWGGVGRGSRVHAPSPYWTFFHFLFNFNKTLFLCCVTVRSSPAIEVL